MMKVEKKYDTRILVTTATVRYYIHLARTHTLHTAINISTMRQTPANNTQMHTLYTILVIQVGDRSAYIGEIWW